MFPAELVINVLAGASLLLGFAWVVLTMHVLFFAEKRHSKVPSWIQFWPFLAEMKDIYPSSCRAGRLLTIWASILVLPWLFGRFLGYI
jgi:hypothetical protein